MKRLSVITVTQGNTIDTFYIEVFNNLELSFEPGKYLLDNKYGNRDICFNIHGRPGLFFFRLSDINILPTDYHLHCSIKYDQINIEDRTKVIVAHHKDVQSIIGTLTYNINAEYSRLMSRLFHIPPIHCPSINILYK